MKFFTLITAAAAFSVGGVWASPASAGECNSGLCGTPNQSGGGGGCGCGCGSILVAMTDRGDTYQFADDFDADGIEDEFDNCPFKFNFDQMDLDADGAGDSCDVCPNHSDPHQEDLDGDSIGDICDPDLDGDTVINTGDNCVAVPNVAQTNSDGDVNGDVCDDDDDNDNIPDLNDPCRLVANDPLTLELVGSGACDDDVDQDGIGGSDDNCASIFNPGQENMNGNLLGNACDPDIDGDGLSNFIDNCPEVGNPAQLDLDHDGLGDAGNWNSGPESCDTTECYVIAGNADTCLNPRASFDIELALVIGASADPRLTAGEEITIALFSNRMGQAHRWTARLAELPGVSDAVLYNAKGSGTTLGQHNPQVANCLRGTAAGCEEMNNIRLLPDEPGTYIIEVTAELSGQDPLGPNVATATIVAEVEGDPSGGCAAAGGTSLIALAMGLLMVGRRRRR